MIVQVQLFARARDLAGAGVAEVELPEGSRVRDLKRQLGLALPRLRQLLERSAIAVNDEYVADDDVLVADAEIALIPPVSGG